MRKAQLAKTYTPELQQSQNVAASAQAADAVGKTAAIEDEHLQVAIALGAEHTAWRRDRISPSARARRLLEKIKPFFIKVLSFWDHRITRISLEGRDLFIDSSGSYQVV